MCKEKLQHPWKTQKMGRTEKSGTVLAQTATIIFHPHLNPAARGLCHSSRYIKGRLFFHLWTRSCACLGWQDNSNCDTSKGMNQPRQMGPALPVARITSTTLWASAEEGPCRTLAIPAAQGEAPARGRGPPPPSRPGQASQATRTTPSQPAEGQGIACCLKSLSLQRTMKSTKGHLRWISKIILQWRRTSSTEQKSWREKNFSSPKITHTYLAWQKPLSTR